MAYITMLLLLGIASPHEVQSSGRTRNDLTLKGFRVPKEIY